MSAVALSALRLRQLDAMGVVAYRLRSAVTPAAAPVEVEMPVASAAGVRVAVICEQPADTVAALIASALGVPATALHWQVPRDGRLPELDENAAAFLVLGQHLARVLGAGLPTTAQQAATIVVTAAPAQWRGDAVAKRLLWQALRPLRRHLRGQTWSRS